VIDALFLPLSFLASFHFFFPKEEKSYKILY
jgi:hypothetical protein